MRRILGAALLLTSLLVLAPPAAAQDTTGWIYISRAGDIIAMRPDGSGAVNITDTPTILERDPDVSNISGREMFVQVINDQGQIGIRNLNLVSGGSFDNVPFQGQEIGDPSYGFDDSVLYLHFRRSSIQRVEVFEGGQTEVAGANFERVYHPNGSPMSNDVFAYVAEVGGVSAVRVQGPGVGDGALGTNNGNGTYPSFAPDASFLVFTCGSQAQLCRADATPGSTATVIPTPTAALNPAVSPQGDRVAWRDTAGNVWVAGLDGSNPTRIANGIGGEIGEQGLDWGMDIPLVAAPPAEDPPPAPVEDPAPNSPLDPGGTDGDPATTERAAFSRPTPYSTAVSAARFADAAAGFAGADGAQAAYAILGRDDDFADSLAGSPLTARGPLLYTSSAALDPDVATELQRVLPAGGTVYLLGGEVALSSDVEQAVRDLGLTPVRLAGPSRFETAAAVAAEVLTLGASGDEFVLARGVGSSDNPTAAWADSVTGGVYAAENFIPVLITPSGSLHPAVAAYEEANGGTATLLGGTAALSESVEEALPMTRRIAGASRADTAAMIATDLLDSDVTEPRAYLLFDGFAEDGWTFGLAGAGLGADLDAPLLVSGAMTLPPETAVLLSTCGDPVVETLLLGWEGVIGAEVQQEVDRLDGQACDAA